MLLYPHSDANSDDDRLELLADPELAQRLRKANPKFFTRAGHTSIAKILALAGIVSLVSGYFIEPFVVAPYRNREAMVTTQIRHVPPVAPRVTVRHYVPPPAHVKSVAAGAHTTIVVAPEPVPQLQPQKTVQRRARRVAVTQPQPEAQAQREEQFWLKAQAEARAKDSMRAKAAATTAAAQNAAQEDTPIQASGKPPVDTGDPPSKIIVTQPPVNAPRGPVNEPFPNIPGGGPCTPGRGPILVGGHGLGGMIINSVIQSVIPIHHAVPFGRP